MKTPTHAKQKQQRTKAKPSSTHSPKTADETTDATTTSADVAEQTPAEVVPPDPGTWRHFNQMVERANRGDAEGLELLRTYLNHNPRLWQFFGNLTARAEKQWLTLICGQDKLQLEAAKRWLATQKATLRGEHATPLESLLVDNVAITGLAVHAGEMAAASTKPRSLAQGFFALRQAESAQKRHLLAVKTLATLRTVTARGLAPLDAVRLFTPKEESA